MGMSRKIWLLCYRGVRKHTYLVAVRARREAQNTLLHDIIGSIMGGCAFKVFFAANKIKAALVRNVREKRMKEHRATQTATHVIQQILGRHGPERLLELLPYVNGYKMQSKGQSMPYTCARAQMPAIAPGEYAEYRLTFGQQWQPS